jgi:hypothetical protein
MAEEWRVEVELTEEGHGLSLGERLRTLDLDDEVRERLGDGIIVTRDGSKMFLYAPSREAAEQAADVLRKEAGEEGLDAGIEVTHWESGDHAWEDIHAAAHEEGHPEERATGVPFLVFLESHKPQFLRDLGL